MFVSCFIKFAGDDYSSSQQLLEVLWVYENQMLERKINSDEEFVAKARRMQEQVEANSLSQLHTSTAPDVHSMASDSQAASHTTCVVCMCNPRSFTLIPCGHMAVCQSCCSRLKQCPLCRAVIRGVIRTYVWLTRVDFPIDHRSSLTEFCLSAAAVIFSLLTTYVNMQYFYWISLCKLFSFDKLLALYSNHL